MSDMEAMGAPADRQEMPPLQMRRPDAPRSMWNRPLSSLVASLVENREVIAGFLSLTGGSILYALSALSIVYGITRIIGPPLAKSSVLQDILPCVAVLNVYELALLAVLLLIVVWRSVLDDAVSLVVLVSLFLVASGMTLGVVAPSGLDICLSIGLACTAVGFAKLYVLRRFIGLRIGWLSVLGLMLIMAWNFLGSSLMARPIMARVTTDGMRKDEWLLAWLVILIGAALVFVEAVRKEYPPTGEQDDRPAFLRTSAMAWMFVLVLLCAAGVHQYAVAYMFAVDYVPADFIPLAAAWSLLALELVRSLGKRFVHLEIAVASVPLVISILAAQDKLVSVPRSMNMSVISYPPIVLGLTGLIVLWISFRHRWRELRYVAIAYVLGVLLTVGHGPGLNWTLGGAGVVAVFLAIGIVHRNVTLCFAAVIALAIGLGTTDMLAGFAKAHNLTPVGAGAGMVGIGSILIALAFGRKTPRAVILIGTISAVICVFDYLPKSLRWPDLVIAAVIAVTFTALLVRTRYVTGTLILWIPILPRAYLFTKTMSSWNFVALSFLLLFMGALTSLFFKQKMRPRRLPCEQSTAQER
jgi:hypothetical protein